MSTTAKRPQPGPGLLPVREPVQPEPEPGVPTEPEPDLEPGEPPPFPKPGEPIS
jgi:hypothetical protein